MDTAFLVYVFYNKSILVQAVYEDEDEALDYINKFNNEMGATIAHMESIIFKRGNNESICEHRRDNRNWEDNSSEGTC